MSVNFPFRAKIGKFEFMGQWYVPFGLSGLVKRPKHKLDAPQLTRRADVVGKTETVEFQEPELEGLILLAERDTGLLIVRDLSRLTDVALYFNTIRKFRV